MSLLLDTELIIAMAILQGIVCKRINDAKFSTLSTVCTSDVAYSAGGYSCDTEPSIDLFILQSYSQSYASSDQESAAH